MGLVHVTVRLRNLAGDEPGYEADFLVDTGATDSMAPEDRLAEAGIKPEGRSTYELANGQPVEYDYGFARVSFMGEETVAPVILGPVGSEPILGCVALESVGVMVDPVTRTLKRLPAKPLK